MLSFPKNPDKEQIDEFYTWFRETVTYLWYSNNLYSKLEVKFKFKPILKDVSKDEMQKCLKRVGKYVDKKLEIFKKFENLEVLATKVGESWGEEHEYKLLSYIQNTNPGHFLD